MRQKLLQPSRLAAPVVLGLALLALLTAGCGGTSSKTTPYVGALFVQGRPAVGAAVTFYPLSPQKPQAIPTAVVEPDGSFRLTTVSAYDGAPPGEYVVCVTWCDSRREDGETLTGPDRLGWRYANPSYSTLKATVLAGKNPPARLDLN